MSEKQLARLAREKAALERRLEREQLRQERERARAALAAEWSEFKRRLQLEMTYHIGKANAIGMAALAQVVFQVQINDSYNQTEARLLRKLITEVKYDPVRPLLIAHSCCTIRPGYYIPATDSERREYREREDRQVKRKIKRNALLFQLTDEAYLSQLTLGLRIEAQPGVPA